jgi:hypothetical protein
MLSPAETDAVFIATVVFVLIAILYGLAAGLERLGYTSAQRARIVTMVGFAMIVWYGIIGVAAQRGFFMDFASIPPKVFFANAPTMAVMLVLAFNRNVQRIANAIAPHWLVGLQVFRVPIEIVLWQLALQGRIATMMSFEGQNFDIITGVTAPLVAWMAIRSGNSRVVKAWNVLGLLLLANVAVRGMLSAPSRFQVIHTDPPNTIIGTFPYIWLPCIAVAAAAFLHIVSLRQKKRHMK